METKSYRLYHEDFKFTDLLWYDLINVQEGYPEFCDMFDRHGEISDDYADSFNVDIFVLEHENVRITQRETLKAFLANDANTSNELDEAVYEFLFNQEIHPKERYFQFAGDGGALGFIVDVWDNPQLEGEPVDSLQVWFDDYPNKF